MKPRIVAIIQARMASSRLPDKVLLDIAGEPMLVRVVERTRKARTLDEVVVATTKAPSDDAVEDLCSERSYLCYRGSNRDVLDRYYQAARTFNAEVIVRITADCPIIDPGVIDKTVYALGSHLSNWSRYRSVFL
jgi:spore coat polysaccharide biosynthesis protein SpsF